MAVLEAGACALPTVATGVPGTREAILDGETGWLVAPGDIAAWADAIGRAMALPAAARAAMMSLRGDRGGILGVMPNLLVVPPSLEENARTLLRATTIAEVVGGSVPVTGGTAAPGAVVPVTNVWHQSADLLVTPFLA